MKTSSQQQMRLLFFKEDRMEGKVGVEKALPSLHLPGTVASAPSTVLRSLFQVDSRCPVPDAATPSALAPGGRPALVREALCSLGCVPLLA